MKVIRVAHCTSLLTVSLAFTLFITGCASGVQPASSAAPDIDYAKDYAAGMAAYNAKDFKGAAAAFEKSVQKGNRTPAVYLQSAHAFAGLGQPQRAYQTYEIVVTSFKGTPEAAAAGKAMAALKAKVPSLVSTISKPSTASTTNSAPASAADVPGGLMSRTVVTPPLFGHKPVSAASINAVKEAIAALPPHLRKMLDDASDARVIISPNMIDRWPESVKDIPEDTPALNLAELPGRIYGRDMCVYERAKMRGSNSLKEARPPKFIRLQVANMCFQLLDDMMTISKDEALRAEWERDKKMIPAGMHEPLATFMKEDDWGPRETCSELFGSMMGGYDENTDNLYRYFPNTKKYLIKKMGIK